MLQWCYFTDIAAGKWLLSGAKRNYFHDERSNKLSIKSIFEVLNVLRATLLMVMSEYLSKWTTTTHKVMHKPLCQQERESLPAPVVLLSANPELWPPLRLKQGNGEYSYSD